MTTVTIERSNESREESVSTMDAAPIPCVAGKEIGLRITCTSRPESDAVDGLGLPFYSSRHPTGSHGWGNQFDLGDTRLEGVVKIAWSKVPVP